MTGERRRTGPLPFTLLLWALTSTAAHAAEPRGSRVGSAEAQRAEQVASAEALFDAGRSLYDAGLFSEACTKLDESQRLDPSVGTEGLLAACREQEGRLATAYRGYVAAEERARAAGDRRAQFAAARAASLAPRVPRLRFRVDQPPPGLQVEIDGVPLSSRSLASGVMADPGPLLVEATAPGRLAFHTTVEMKVGEQTVVAIPALALRSTGTPRAALGPTPEPASHHPAASRSNPRRTVGWTVGAVGLAGVGVGAGLGALALTQRSASNEHCGPENRCTPLGGELRDEARVTANVATAAFAAGLGGLAVGAVLLLWPETRDERPSHARGPQLVPAAGPGSAGAFLLGHF
ncbi:hypothetical protein [Chondromyces apiculatus]|uniref:PEGA domain-containing protein n=1 Tax=Chondromyces apiculatus DSM 436 TaxID=1192034 RepID=A0A017T9E2_9BACT|nr:hypothetical protein [Chondromyces apiculatus]EYF05435.1 Hypothetical protein CAP_3352 [Chondromyces apiculatus DSM 436]